MNPPVNWKERALKAEAENVRHRNANLVRAAVDGFEEWIGEAIAAEDWDVVPWLVTNQLHEQLRRADDMLKMVITERDLAEAEVARMREADWIPVERMSREEIKKRYGGGDSLRTHEGPIER